MRAYLGPWTYVALALVVTGGAAITARSHMPARDDPDALAKRELETRGIVAPAGELAPIADQVTEQTSVVPLVAAAPFRLSLANGPLEGEPLARDRVKAVLAVLRRELARYPKARLQEAGLRRIVLAADLRESGKLISSLPNVAGSLLLDGSVPDAFLPRLVHHEIFHFLDFADRERHRENDEWRVENGTFAYGEGGRSVRYARASDVSDEMPGFLTRYSMSAVEEDKAEVFSLLMTSPQDVRGRAARDGVVRAKVRRLGEKLDRLAPELSPMTTL